VFAAWALGITWGTARIGAIGIGIPATFIWVTLAGAVLLLIFFL
jgi:hypothetical protein